MEEKICPGCGAKVPCGRAPGQDRCWCAELPRIMPVPDPAESCYCPECLAREIQRRQQSGAKS